MKYFQEVSIAHVLACVNKRRDTSVVDVDAGVTVEEVLRVLNEVNILSVPVYCRKGSWMGAGMNDETVDTAQGKEYIGIASILDITHWLFSRNTATGMPVGHGGMLLLQVPISQVLGQTAESSSLWVTVASSTLLDAMEPLCKGVHRMLVAVKGDNNQVHYQMLSQTDILAYLQENFAQISTFYPRLNSDSVTDLGLVPVKRLQRSTIGKRSQPYPTREKKKILTIWDSTLVADALKHLCQHPPSSYNRHLHSLPIVDPIGDRVVGTFSVSDLRSLNAEKLQKLPEMTVGNYLRWIYNIQSYEDLPEPRICTRSSHLKEVIDQLLEQPVVHRLWIIESEEEYSQNEGSSSVDEDDEAEDEEDETFVEVKHAKYYRTSRLRLAVTSKPMRLCGVISMTDVIRCFWKQAMQAESIAPPHDSVFAQTSLNKPIQ